MENEKLQENGKNLANTIRGSFLSQKISNVHIERRALLKWGLIGGGAFLLGKIFGDYIPFFSGSRVVAEKEFKNFKLVETNRELTVYNKDRDKIVIFEKN